MPLAHRTDSFPTPAAIRLPLVTVVIPTYQRPDLLDRCLAAVMRQETTFPYEVLVVEDGGGWSTEMLAILRHHEQPAVLTGRHLRYLPAGSAGYPSGPAAARNLGAEAARGLILAFTDDDTIPEPGWLAAGVAAIDRDEAAAAAGRTIVPLPAVPTDYERNAAALAGVGFITANCFVKRQVLVAIGGFDARYRDAWREDSDLYFALVSAGMRVTSEPDAVVVHPIRPAPWGVSLSQQRKSVYNALLYKKYPQLIKRHPPLRYYVIVLATLVAAGLGLWGSGLATQGLLIGLCLAVAISHIAIFCAERLTGTAHTPTHIAEMVVTSCLIPFLAVFWRLVGALRFRVVFF